VLCHSVDVDIDLARGLKHVVEFLDNNVFRPGQKTDQTLVYALLFNQNITPEYKLDRIQAAAAVSAAIVRRKRAPGPRSRRKTSSASRAARPARRQRRG
jgi:hypothetical protein